jgi:hypothetical protein
VPLGQPTSIQAHETWVSPWQDAAVVCVEHGSLTAIAGMRFDALAPGWRSDD